VLDAIANALGLNETERDHVHDLAAPAPTRRRRPRAPQRVLPGIARLVAQLTGHPAVVLGRRTDVLAWNPMASALLGDFSRLEPRMRKMARLAFLDDETIALYPEWERVGRETVAYLRRYTVRDLDDSELAELIGELSLKSEHFRRWWNSREVKDKASGTKRFNHPIVGELELHYETLYPGGTNDQALVIYAADHGTPSHTALQLLTTVAASQQASDPQRLPDRSSP
jgi:hypothetical protein